jgi:branched-chain amino acid transport system ATP-binding protein
VTSPLLSLRGVERRLGGVQILAGVDLDVAPRSLVALVGPNGAGKTTLFQIVSGLARPSAGSVRFDGREIAGLPPQRIARLGIGRTFQTARLFPGLTVLENVLVGITFGRGDRPRLAAGERPGRAERLTSLVGLHPKRAALARSLSLGEQKRLELALALALAPRLLLLDELASGLSPRGREEVIRYYGRLRERGLTILAIEHSLGVLTELADHVVVLDQGRVVAAGGPREVLASPAVSEAYFGEEHAP